MDDEKGARPLWAACSLGWRPQLRGTASRSAGPGRSQSEAQIEGGRPGWLPPVQVEAENRRPGGRGGRIGMVDKHGVTNCVKRGRFA